MSIEKRRKFIKNSLVGASALALTQCTKKRSESTGSLNKKIYNWKMVTTWPKNFPGVGVGANNLAHMIEKMSGGRINVKVFGAGELVGALDIFDAVKNGTAEIGHGASYYWRGKHEATQFFSSVPFGLTANEMNAWLAYGGGQELWNELYAGFDLVPFNAGNTGVQMGGWYNKEINTLENLKGLKVRMPGLGGEVLRRLGATVVTLPGGEIFQALQTGTIDASEWVGPYNDLAFGFHKAAKFYYWPGWHEPGTTLECIINRKLFDELESDLKEIVKQACHASSMDMLAEFTARNGSALQTLKEKFGVKSVRFPNSVIKELGKTAESVLVDVSKKDPFTKKVFDSFIDFRQKSMLWSQISEQGYTEARQNALG